MRLFETINGKIHFLLSNIKLDWFTDFNVDVKNMKHLKQKTAVKSDFKILKIKSVRLGSGQSSLTLTSGPLKCECTHHYMVYLCHVNMTWHVTPDYLNCVSRTKPTFTVIYSVVMFFLTCRLSDRCLLMDI